MKIDYQLKLLNNILSVNYDGEHILLCDNAYNVFFYSVKEKRFVFGKRVSGDPGLHHIYSKALAISKQNHVLYSEVESGECKLYCIENQQNLKLIGQVSWHKLNISSAAFNASGTLVATGGEDGRVCVRDCKGLNFYALCPVQSDYISCIRFDTKNNYIAFGTYGSELLVYNLQTFEFDLKLETPSVCMDILFYNNDSRLFYICKDGQIGFYDFIEKSNSISQLCNSWLHCCTLNKNSRYAYVAGRDDKLWVVSLFDPQESWVLDLPEKGVSALASIERYLCVCFVNGKIIFIFCEHEKEGFIKLLDEGKFAEARRLAENENIFLKWELEYSQTRTRLWNEVKQEVVKLFADDQIEKALDLAKPYLEDSRIDNELKTLLEQRYYIGEFLKAVEDGEYQKAYEIAEQRPAIKAVSAYQNLENYFERIFETAKKMLEEDYSNQIFRVKKLLEPFVKVPFKKERISILFDNFTQYRSIQEAFKEQDYRTCYDLGQEYPFLKITKAYRRAFNYYQKMLIAVQQGIMSEQGSDFSDELSQLMEIADFKQDAQMLSELSNAQKDLSRAYKDGIYSQCYEILDKYPALISSSAHLEMENHIQNVFGRAMDLAQAGKTSDVYDILSQFFPIARWKKRLNNLFQIAYFYEMRMANSALINWEETLKSYCRFFGKDSELAELCALIGISHIYREVHVEVMDLPYVRSILVRKK